jgi:hypothetical protein
MLEAGEAFNEAAGGRHRHREAQSNDFALRINTRMAVWAVLYFEKNLSGQINRKNSDSLFAGRRRKLIVPKVELDAAAIHCQPTGIDWIRFYILPSRE